MACLLTDAVVREAMAAPPGGGGIRTHQPIAIQANTQARRGRPSLHDQLYAEWQAKNWQALADAARAYLAASGRTPQLSRITDAAIAFFGAVAIGSGDTERFLAGYPAKELDDYLSGPIDEDRGRIADAALALHCLGMLGEAEFDYIGALRTIEALRLAIRLTRGRRRTRISPELIHGWIETEVFLPDWSFQIDICRDSNSDEGWPVETPLGRRLARRAAAVSRSAARDPGGCDCTPAAPACEPADVCCAEVNYYIAEFLELRDWVHRYKAGDIAYIATVAARETHSREHEMKRTRELFSETETKARASESRDLQVSDRGSLKREIERQREQSASLEASAETSYNSGVYKGSLSATGKLARSSSEALKEAQEKAVETVKKAVSELEKESRSLSSERLTTEEIERNSHVIANKSDTTSVTQYFWVTKECRAQLFSHGKQLIAEFIVPEPARLYETLVERRIDAELDVRMPPPKYYTNDLYLGWGPDFITRGGYEELATYWHVKNPPPCPAETMELKLQTTLDVAQGEQELPPLSFAIPDGYEAVKFEAQVQADFIEKGWPWNWNGRVVLQVPAAPLQVFEKGTATTSTLTLAPPASGSFDVRVFAQWAVGTKVDGTLKLKLTGQAFKAWQQQVFDLIEAEFDKAVEASRAYRTEREAARRELLAAEAQRHPFYKRETERTELKRAIIYLMCQDFSTDGAIIRKAEPCGLPEIHRSKADAEGYEWYFWDRLIDWSQMAYAFFDYFWNPMCDWPQRFDPDEPDALFKAFRRAGYARVLVPVSPAMHRDFLWYVNTHQKWGQEGHPPRDFDDPRWRNVVFEMEHANASAMTPREGHIVVNAGTAVATITRSDRYWTPDSPPTAGGGWLNTAAIALDTDREIYIEGEVYRIVSITRAPGSSDFDPNHPNSMSWQVILDRIYPGPEGTWLYAMGAKAVAPVFSFDVPTELIWCGEHNKCLPTYPLPACVE